MKRGLLNKIIVVMCCVVFSTMAYAGNDKPIVKGQLPKAAQQIIDKNFAGKKIALMTMEAGVIDKSYDVVFADGDKIEFDRKGRWTSVSCRKQPVPNVFIPAKIASYLKDMYPGVSIRKIEKDDKDYDVELSNGLDITFNKKFQVIEIDR